MSKPKILIFASREEPDDAIAALEAMGCEIAYGDPDWQNPERYFERRDELRRQLQQLAHAIERAGQ